MATAEDLELAISTNGQVPPMAKERVAEKIAGLLSHVREPVLFGEARLTEESNANRERPAIAEATLWVNGTPVRAQVAAGDMDAAIDLLEERLRRRIGRHEERLHRRGKDRHRVGEHGGDDDGWRHGDLPTQRPEWFERPVDEREVIRHKTFALEPMSIDEAAFDLDALGHDFYLFTEITTTVDAVISFGDNSGFALRLPEGVNSIDPSSTAVPLQTAPPAPTLSLTEAKERLDDGGEPFVFFIDAVSSRGHVVYHRYDGHYGLITPAI